MSTTTPSALFKAWSQETLPIEMAMGHTLQNLVKQQTLLDGFQQALSTLRTDVDRLIAQAGLLPDPKVKRKPRTTQTKRSSLSDQA